MRNKLKKRGGLAISQIFLLIISIVAISYAIGSHVGFVSAQAEGELCTKGKNGLVVKVNTITNVNQWCLDNGATRSTNSPVCNWIGTNVWELKTFECATDQEGRSFDISMFLPNPVNLFKFPSVGPFGGGATDEAEEEIEEEVVEAAKKGIPFFSISGKKALGAIARDAAIAVGIYYGSRALLKEIPFISPELADSLAAGLGAGYGVHQTLLPLINKLSFINIGGPAGWVITGIFAIGIFLVTYRDTKYAVVTFTCYPWGAPSGGENCEECDKQGLLSCGEYQCRSLGRSCSFLSNEGLCAYNDTSDVSPPEIRTWIDVLTPEYVYSPDNTISPPDIGVRIVGEEENGCIKPFTPLRFGITLDEPAKCKIDSDREREFEDMSTFFSGSFTDKYNHSHTLSLPSPENLEAQGLTLQTGNEFSLYARCEDLQGNSNPANFVFRFCVDEGPDTFPPVIISTSILNGMPIAFNQNSVDLQVYVNEPSECRWSHLDKSYDDMETQMSCDPNVLDMNAQQLYPCSTTLTGLNDGVDNDFYFRCKDQPIGVNESERNANPSSFKFTLVGTRPLVIDSVGPNETIRDSTDIVKVTLEAETSAGFNEGAATCYFGDTGINGSFVKFFNTESHEHSQDLFLPEGDYIYNIRCVDLGGNADDTTTSFRVETDTQAPVVVRAFHEGSSLKIITSEKAGCVYDSVDCSYLFEDGIKMTVTNDIEHSTTWDPNTNFYVKCQDEFTNKPFPNQCSIIVRPFEV